MAGMQVQGRGVFREPWSHFRTLRLATGEEGAKENQRHYPQDRNHRRPTGFSKGFRRGALLWVNTGPPNPPFLASDSFWRTPLWGFHGSSINQTRLGEVRGELLPAAGQPRVRRGRSAWETVCLKQKKRLAVSIRAWHSVLVGPGGSQKMELSAYLACESTAPGLERAI